MMEIVDCLSEQGSWHRQPEIWLMTYVYPNPSLSVQQPIVSTNDLPEFHIHAVVSEHSNDFQAQR